MDLRIAGVNASKSIGTRVFPKGRFDGWKMLGYAGITVWALLSLFPLYWMVATGIRPTSYSIELPPEWIPTKFTLANLGKMFALAPALRWTFNSFVVASAVALSNVFWSALAGYTLSKKQFPGDKVIFWMIVGLIFVPWQLMLVPLFMLMRNFGLLDTYGALIFPELIYPYTIFLMKQYLSTLPSELLDAAKIDGASEFGVFHRIVMPLALPGLAVVGIFTFMGNWNNFIWPLLVTNSEEMRTLQVGLSKLQSHWYTDYGLLMAGASFSAIPMIIVFLAFQRLFLRGITVGAVKG